MAIPKTGTGTVKWTGNSDVIRLERSLPKAGSHSRCKVIFIQLSIPAVTVRMTTGA